MTSTTGSISTVKRNAAGCLAAACLGGDAFFWAGMPGVYARYAKYSKQSNHAKRSRATPHRRQDAAQDLDRRRRATRHDDIDRDHVRDPPAGRMVVLAEDA